MSRLAIRLLGPPGIERDGRPAPPPRGRKAWALLAYLLLAGRPASRAHLSELLFGNADDPLGALRWTLAELRRALGAPELFGGDPVATALGPGVEVDAHAVTAAPASATRRRSRLPGCWPPASTTRPSPPARRRDTGMTPMTVEGQPPGWTSPHS